MSCALFTMEERRVTHAAELFEVLRDPRIFEFLDQKPPASIEELETILERSESRRSPDGKEHWLNWIVRTDTGAIAGYVQATVEETTDTNVAYVFSPLHQSQGIASAAVQRMIDEVAKNYQPRAYFIITEAENQKSIRLALRLGFAPAPESESIKRNPGMSELLFWKQGLRIEA